MPQIQQLPRHVADLIAAGEVVERPASVVKELVENAIDAGASAVAVEIRRGGMGLIRVSDNGCGISPEELPTAFLRHATSKLRGADDLGRIGTLGFRGEALAAISAVSRVEVLSRQKGQAAGAALRLEGGIPETVEAVGTPEGTTLLVRDLFFNTPARLKFMKKDSAETAAVAGLMQHLALSHPDVSFQFLKDGQEALHTPGDGKLESAIYAALGREFAKSLLPVEGSGGEVSVCGFVTQPLLGRGSRSMQVFFVNGRFIKSQLLTAALEEGYRNQIMKGKFPGCVLAVTLPVTDVDVNVHPAKTQVKFAREREVFDAVFHTVMDSLEAQGAPTAESKPVAQMVNPRQDFFQTMDAQTYREQGVRSVKKPEVKPVVYSQLSARSGNGVVVLKDSGAELSEYRSVRSGEKTARRDTLAPFAAQGPKHTNPVLPELRKEESPEPPQRERPFVPAIPVAEPPEEQQTFEKPGEAPWRMVGEVFHTYILCEDAADTLWLIDKHAAHERVNFDRMKAALEPPMRQTLLTPVVVELAREDGALLLDHLSLMERMGFSCEDFGDGAILVREVPADLDAADTAATLEEFAENLRSGRSLDEKREKLLHTMACKAAIKGGWTSGSAELQALVEKVQSGEVRYCPHGRPVAVKVSRYELEKLFKRA